MLSTSSSAGHGARARADRGALAPVASRGGTDCGTARRAYGCADGGLADLALSGIGIRRAAREQQGGSARCKHAK
jgi:hypothetical protein